MRVFVGQRDVVVVSGEEAASYLQGQISQDVEMLTGDQGASAWSLILQPQGKVDAWFRITATEADDTFILDVDAGHGEALLTRLKRFKLRTKAELSLETWDWHAFREMPTGDTLSVLAEDGAVVVASSGAPGTYDVIGPALSEPAEEQMSALEFDRLRIRDMVPAMGAELTESTIPAEAGIVDRSVSFTKGCYTGQELVARVDSRGSNTPRKLRLIEGPGFPDVGSELTVDGATVGALTSVAADDDGFVALAYIKRLAHDATSAQLGDVAVSVHAEPQGTTA